MPGFWAKYATYQHGNRSVTYRRHPVLRYFVIILAIAAVCVAVTVAWPVFLTIGVVLVVVAIVGALRRSKRLRQ